MPPVRPYARCIEDLEDHSNYQPTDPELLLQKQEKGGKPVTDPEWEWPCFSRFFHNGKTRIEVLKKPSNSGSPALVGSATPFTVTYTERQGLDPDVHVTLFSQHLVNVAKTLLPTSKASSSETPELPADSLFLALGPLQKQLEILEGIEAAADIDGQGGSTTIEDGSVVQERCCHLRHLVRFVEQEFKELIVRHKQVEAKGRLSYDMLWTVMRPQEPVRFFCHITNRPRLGIVQKASGRREGDNFRTHIQAMNYNVQFYRKCSVVRFIPSFHEYEVALTELPVCPLRYFGAQERASLEAGFAELGDRFYDLAMSAPFRFVAYTGSLAFEAGAHIMKRKADGRVMVDHRNFARMHPSYRMGDAQPPTDILKTAGAAAHPRPKAEDLRLAPAIVYGFSLTLKRWGCFDVMGFSEISFDSAAFDELVMRDPEQKDMLISLVGQYVQPKRLLHGHDPGQQQDARADRVDRPPPPLHLDAISSKGNGCIFLCYGPPGTGKTLTAESLAEKLQCPLWAMNAFELPSSDPGEMESRLLQIFDIAVSWNAILLLDEAEVYMERRRTGAGGRASSSNAMTGVFLRLLEYYAGVLFLTTNRVEVFDEAFRSRISMIVEYPPLSDGQREAIWAKLLSKARLPTDEAKDLAKHDLNGREIRNILVVTLMWARSSNRSVSMADVHSVVRMSIAGTEALNAAAADATSRRE